MTRKLETCSSSPIEAGPCVESLYQAATARKDGKAQEALVKRWNIPAYRIAKSICINSALAEEATQEAFLCLFNGTAVFRRRESAQIDTWFLGVVSQRAKMVLRSELRDRARRQFAVAQKGTGYSNGDRLEQTLYLELNARIRSTLQSVEDRLKIPLIYHFFKGCRQKEMASMLGLSQQAVSKRIHEGLAELRFRLLGIAL